MTGGDHHPYKADPAVDRWQAMHDSMYQRFRMTPRNTRIVLMWGVTVPLLTFYLAGYSNNRWEWRGKTRGESLLKNPPSAKASDEE